MNSVRQNGAELKNLSQRQLLESPTKRCTIATSTTAPSVAAASEYRNPPSPVPILSCVKIQPPITEPIRPRTMSVMQPYPRPRASFPASQPATSPRKSHAISPRGHHCTTTTLSCSKTSDATMRAPNLHNVLLKV